MGHDGLMFICCWFVAGLFLLGDAFVVKLWMAEGLSVRRQLSALDGMNKRQLVGRLEAKINNHDNLTSIASDQLSTVASSRRQHKNKYEHLSTKKIDPLQVAVDGVQKQAKKLEDEVTVTGTTIPTVEGSNAVEITKKPTKSGSWFCSHSVVPADPSTFGYTEIGRIIGPHGIKGEVKMEVSTDFADYRVKSGGVLYLKKPTRRSPRPVVVLASRKVDGNQYLVTLQGIRNRLLAEKLTRYVVFAKRDDRPQLNDDEYLLNDLVGLKCYLSLDDLSAKRHFAKVEGVVPPDELVDLPLRSKMHSLLEVRLRNTTQHCLVPFVPAIVVDVLLDQAALIIEPPEGLFSLTYEVDTKVTIRGYLPSRVTWLSDAERERLMRNSVQLFADGGVIVDE